MWVGAGIGGSDTLATWAARVIGRGDERAEDVGR
jgi:hypothetical protein